MICVACGQANPETAKFCNECATPLQQDGGHEVRKTLTVLFADLVGFTSLSERLDQESLRRVMDRFYEEMRGAVHAHGGTVAKFIGDAVMAVWGTPVVREDDALRAVRAAEEMRGALAALNLDLERRWGVRVGMRTGVNTGEVVVDPTKPADLLVGDTLNVAARLEQAAPDGAVLVGPETFRLVREHTTLEPVEPLQLKGKTRRLPAYRLVDGLRPDRRRDERMSAPLVGRDDELARLRAAFDAAAAARETRLVTVVASPGVGKTRLSQELAKGLEDEARILRGHCEPATEGATFLPVAEVLREAGGLAAVTDEDPRVRDGIAAVLGEGRPVAAEETFWAVRRFLEALAAQRPLVVVLDDVHWGEPTFLDLVEHLAGWGRDAPILLVALARPELRDVRPGLCEATLGSVAHDTLALEPLPRDASRALVDGLLGAADLPEPLSERLLETADGNPLFLGEMLRMLVDDGVLRREGDTWVVAEAERVSVPPTIQALLAARLERLPVPERTVAEHAAVIGPQFSRAAVAELAGPAVASTIDEHLDALRRKELITTAAGPPDDPSFRFGHALIRDAAYRPLLKEARAELHERFAVWLEERGDEHDEIIGFHLERAFGYRRELGTLDDAARDLGRRAGERLCVAGRRALDREDLPAATNLLTRALAVLEADEAARSEALVDLAEALLSAGDTARGGEVVEELALRAAAADDDQLQALATVFGGQLANLVGGGGVRETIGMLEQAGEVLARAGDARGEAKAHHVIAGAHALLGEVAAAEAALDRALVAARTAGDRRRVTAVLSGAPRAALWGPSPVVRASGRCLDVVRIVRMTPGNRHVETMALRCQAVLEAMRGRADAARTILRDGRAALEELGLTLELQELDMYAGIVELLAGEPATAEEHLTAARDGFAALGVDIGAAQAAALLARALLDQDRDDEAIALTEFAEQHGGEDLKTAIAWRGVRAEALARRGGHADAERLAREAVALAEPTDALADKADALMALAAVLRAAGDAAGARETAERAREQYEAKEHEVGVARAVAAAGPTVSPRQADPAAAVPALGDTAAERVLARWLDVVNERRWNDVRDLYSPDLRIVDHRSAGSDMSFEERVLSLRLIEDMVPDFRWELTTLVAVAETHIAAVMQAHGNATVSDGGEVALRYGQISVVRDGQVLVTELFEPDDEPAMLARFDEIGAELPGSTPATWSLAWIQRINSRDWDGVRRMYAPDFAFVDHRPKGTVDAAVSFDDFIAGLQDMAALSPDVRWASPRVIAATDDAWAAVVQATGNFGDGGPLMQAYAVVALVRGGLMVRSEIFEPDDEQAILARFEELRAQDDPVRLALGVDPHAPGIEVVRTLCRAFDARHWEAYRALCADDYAAIDHRTIGFGEDLDADAAVDAARSGVAMVPDARMTTEVLAASGGLVARNITLRGHAADGGGAAEVSFSSVLVVEDGRTKHVEMFETDDRAALLRRFDELLVEQATTPVERVAVEFARLVNAREWDGVAALFSDDFAADLERLHMSLWNFETADELVAEVRELAALAPDLRLHLAMLAAEGDVCAGPLTWAGTYEGGPMIVRGGFVALSRDHRIARLEGYEPDDEEGMLARFAELCRHMRYRDEWVRLYEARDWRGLRALYTDDTTLIDRRHPALWEVDGPDDVVRQLATTVDEMGDIHARVDLLAVEGDVHAQHIVFALDPGGAPSENAAGLVVVLRGDRLAAVEVFDPDDDDGMRTRVAELGARADPVRLAPGVPPDHPMVEVWRRQVESSTRRDWEAFGALFAADYVGVDHRTLGWEPLHGRDAIVRQLRTGFGETDARLAGEVLAVAQDLSVRTIELTGHAHDGGGRFAFEQSAITVVRDGLVCREEFWPLEERGAALARFDELLVETAPTPALRNLAEFQRCFNAGDWSALRSVYTDDFAMVDHRRPALWETGGPDDVVTQLRLASEQGISRIRVEVIAAESDVVAARQVYAVAEANAPAEIAVGTVNVARGDRCALTEVFDPDDEQAMLQRFAELAPSVTVAEGVDPDHPMVEFVRRWAATTHRRDWEALGAFFAPGLEGVDHRRLGWEPMIGRDAAVRNLRTAYGGVEGARLSVEILAADDCGYVRALTFSGRSPEGADFEHTHGAVAIVEDGMIVSEEWLEIDDRAALLARFEELRADRANLAVTARAEFCASFEARDWEALRALHPEDTVVSDHRPIGFGEVRGVDAMLELRRGVADVGAERWRSTPIAVRGRRLALFAEEISKRDPLTLVETLALIQVDADGRLWRTDVYPIEEKDAALERLEELAAFAGACERQLRALISGDWESMRASMAPDAVMEYHPTGDRFAGGDALVAHWRSVREPNELFEGDLDRFDVPAPGVGRRRETWHGRIGGADWEAVQECVCTLDDDVRMVQVEQFLAGDPRIDAAIARLRAAATPLP